MSDQENGAEGDGRTKAIEQVAKVVSSAADSTWTELVLAIGFLLLAHWFLETKLEMKGFETWLGMLAMGVLKKLSDRRQKLERFAAQQEIKELEGRVELMAKADFLFSFCQTLREKCFNQLVLRRISDRNFFAQLHTDRRRVEANLLWSTDELRGLVSEMFDQAGKHRGGLWTAENAEAILAPLDAKIEAIRVYLRGQAGVEEAKPQEEVRALPASDDAASAPQSLGGADETETRSTDPEESA